MTGLHPAVVQLEGANLVLVIVVAVIALAALAMAWMFRTEVLTADEGTDNMKNIAHAVQEGANAYLTRQFRTLGIFAAVAFVALLALPADDVGVRIGRSIVRSCSAPGSRLRSATSACPSRCRPTCVWQRPQTRWAATRP